MGSYLTLWDQIEAVLSESLYALSYLGLMSSMQLQHTALINLSPFFKSIMHYYTSPSSVSPSLQASRDLVCFLQLDHVNVYYGQDYRSKYKAPTDYCLALKVTLLLLNQPLNVRNLGFMTSIIIITTRLSLFQVSHLHVEHVNC